MMKSKQQAAKIAGRDTGEMENKGVGWNEKGENRRRLRLGEV
jgi:hypothetical protein